MKSFLKERELVLKELYEKVFEAYPKEEIIQSVKKLLIDVRSMNDIMDSHIEEEMNGVLNKTETFNVLLTLYELEKRLNSDEGLKLSMEDPSYNQHRTIAINICDMYSSGATSFFGYVDCMFRTFFPLKSPKSFMAKGICALIASTAELIVTGKIEKDYTDKNIELLSSRGIKLRDIVQLVLELQIPYNPTLTLEDCESHVIGVLKKQQTYHTIDLCVKIDRGVENNEFGEQFQSIVGNDEGLYGVDETVNTSISKMYGMIAITNFGHLDKAKPGIIGELDNDHEGSNCNTYADDTVCAIVAAACARLAHNNVNTNSKPNKNDM